MCDMSNGTPGRRSRAAYDREVIDNELVIRRFYDLFNAGDVEAAAGLYAEQCEWEFPAFGAVCRSRREVRDVCAGWRAAFPDGRVDVVNVVVCEDVVVVEWDSYGTWRGPLSEEAGEPNGRRFQRRGCAVAEL